MFGHETAAGVTGSRRTGLNSSAKNKKGRKKDAALPFFHRLRLPWRASQKWTLQIRGGRNPTGLKDAGDFSPAAPSCALLFPSCGLPVSLRC